MILVLATWPPGNNIKTNRNLSSLPQCFYHQEKKDLHGTVLGTKKARKNMAWYCFLSRCTFWNSSVMRK